MDFQPIFDLTNKDTQTLIDNFKKLPCTGNSGAEILSISDDLTHAVMRIPFNEQTQNIMGIMYGGTMYAATDAVYLTMLWYLLGEDYFLIDKSSQVKYLRPGTTDLTVTFHIPDSDITTIIEELNNKRSVSREYLINIIDTNQKSVCKITKEIVIRKAVKA